VLQMMSHPSVSLRAVVGTVVAVVGALAVGTAAALVVLTAELRRTTEELRTAMESVRIAEDAAMELLLHPRVEDALARRNLERSIREKLGRMGSVTRTARAREVLEAANDVVEAYLATEDTAVLLLAATAWLLWWLRARAFEPLVAMADAMKRFGSGDATARAPDEGPAELRAMARQFNEMAASLAALRERHMTFLAALAHDLRNPLSALKLATSRPVGEGDAGDPRLSLVRRQILGLERLVTDFLDMARAEAGQLEIRPERVDVRGIVDNVVSLFCATCTAHRIRAQLPEEAVVAPCDPGRIEQVLTNLVSNAIKYSPSGGDIVIVVEPRKGAIAVSVADEGVGIREAETEAIFEPFRRGKTAPRGVPGVGLGLYVSRRIVEAHGGRICVKSSSGRGSTFEVVLPR
jgi:signal transduction histidine kinase